MDRHNIILGQHSYIVDRISAKEKLSKTSQRFVMLRKFDYLDNLTFDSEVYVIEEGLWDSHELIAYPANNEIKADSTKNTPNLAVMFSIDKGDYSQNLLYGGEDVYPIQGDILTDTIRIYHPHTKVHQDLIIYIDSYISSIHFHLYCRPISTLDPHSSTEMSIDNVYYSEYVEFEVPNLESLFRDGRYSDHINNIEGMNSANVPMSLFKTPFTIDKDGDGTFYKKYVNEPKSTCEDLSKFTNSYNVTLFPYSGIDDTTSIYIGIDDMPSNTDTFTNEIKFSIESSLQFVNGEISIYNKFRFPGDFENPGEAYESYFEVDFRDYQKVVLDNDDEEDYELDEDSIVNGEVMMCGYHVRIATDTKFKNIIYENTNWDSEAIDDFSFQLSRLFTSWDQLPDILVAKCDFQDRYLGNYIEGNQVMITKEHFKYMVNETPMATYRIKLPNTIEKEK